MVSSALHLGDRVVMQPQGLQALIDLLSGSGYRVLGPSIRDGAIVYDDAGSAKDLPVGWTDEHEKGAYRLKKRRDEAVFGYAVGPHSWKQFLHPPFLTLFRARRNGAGFEILDQDHDAPMFAFLGVRPCDLAAIRIQDRVFLGGAHTDVSYKTRREKAFIVAVNCGNPGGNCFCVSMGSGPKAVAGFDISLTEIAERKSHFFLLEVGSDAGARIAAQLDCLPAGDEEIAAAERVIQRAATRMGRTIDAAAVQESLVANYDSPQWENVAERCMTCGNCTAVCPTCFCTTVEDVTDLSGEAAERRQRWDSCFNVDFSYIFGGSVRSTVAARYRQWLVHKLATWRPQFGTPGCVGCGRCITWCPVGIDITAEAYAVGAGKSDGKEQANGNS